MTADNQLHRIAHDPVAFEAFYRGHFDDVLRFITRRVSDPQLAADLTADVFLAAIDTATTYRPDRGTPSAWLYGVARNVVADSARDADRQQRAYSRIAGRRLLDGDDVDRLVECIDAAAAARALLPQF